MSRPKTIGLAIVERLEAIPELEGRVVFFRRKDIESEFAARMAKVGGRAAVVRLVEAPNHAKGKRAPRYGGSYSVALFTSPALTKKDAKDADALMDEIVTQLHGWWPEDDVPSNGMTYLAAGTIGFPEDPVFDLAVLPVETTEVSSTK
jgi:hypothetical protein